MRKIVCITGLALLLVSATPVLAFPASAAANPEQFPAEASEIIGGFEAALNLVLASFRSLAAGVTGAVDPGAADGGPVDVTEGEPASSGAGEEDGGETGMGWDPTG